MMTGGECDFCGTPNTVAWAYPCRDFLTPSPVAGLPDQGSSGAWAACAACHALIERGDRQRLAHRSAKKLSRKTGVPVKAALRGVREIQDGFFSHREGAPVPTTTGANDPTPVGRVAPEHQLGPDVPAMSRALGVESGQVRALSAVDTASVHEHATVFFVKDDGLVYRADVRLAGQEYERASEDVPLGGDWDTMRWPVDLGIGHAIGEERASEDVPLADGDTVHTVGES